MGTVARVQTFIYRSVSDVFSEMTGTFIHLTADMGRQQFDGDRVIGTWHDLKMAQLMK